MRDGDVVMRLDAQEAPVLREYAMALAKQALSTLAARYEFTPRGPILDRDLPQARRLRGPHARPARHDRRPRRLLRPRRHHGLAARPAAGRVPVGSDAVARARARDHAADVEPARAAMADGRHLGLRGKEGARRVGPRDGRHVRRHAESRRDAEAQGSQLGVHQPEDDLARVLPGLAAGRAHRQRLRRRRAAQAGARLRERRGHRRRAEGGAQHRPRSDAGRLRSDDRADVRHDAARDGGAGRRRGTAENAGADAEGDCRRQPAQLPGADGARIGAAQGGTDRRGDAGVRARGVAGAHGRRPGQPARATGGDGAGEEGSRAGDRRAHRARRGRFQQRRGRASAGRSAAAETASRARRR